MGAFMFHSIDVAAYLSDGASANLACGLMRSRTFIAARSSSRSSKPDQQRLQNADTLTAVAREPSGIHAEKDIKMREALSQDEKDRIKLHRKVAPPIPKKRKPKSIEGQTFFDFTVSISVGGERGETAPSLHGNNIRL